MTHEPSILERNLEALFSRAYVPVRASPAFRARLAERLTRELARTPASAGPRGRAWRAAAAVLLLAGAALALWFATHRTRSMTRESLLARGETAVRAHAAGAKEPTGWRALSTVEVERGIELPSGRLELATARASQARVWLGAAGRVDAEPNTTLAIESDTERSSHALQLESGALALERYAPEGGFEIATPHGQLVLERGTLHVAIVAASDLPAGLEPGPAVRARLSSGLAWLDTAPGRTLLGLSSDVYVQGGRIVIAAHPGLDGSVLASGERESAASAPGAPTADGAQVESTPDTARLAGRVLVPEGTAPLERFAVTLLREVRLPDVSHPERHAFEGTHGRFEIPAVRAGTYRVFVEARGYAVWHADVPIVLDAEGSRAIDATLDRGVTLRGRVVDADTHAPIEGAVVLSETDSPAQVVPFSSDAEWMKDWLALVRTGPDGRFEFPALSARSHLLRATREGFGASWSQRLDLADGGSHAEVEIALAPGGTVFGRVARADGRSLPGAIVIASHAADNMHSFMSYGSAVTDADGAFSIGDLAPGMYVVIHVPDPSNAESIEPLVIQVQVERGRSTEVELPGRERGTHVFGRVLAADGSPLADADIMVQATSERGPNGWRAERTHANGDFAFAGLEPTTYDVFVGRGLGQNFVWQAEVEVPDAPRHEVTIRLDAGVLAGHVRDATSRAGLARAVLILEVEREREWQFCGRAISDASGRFEFAHLRAGNYRVDAYATSGRYGPEHTADLWVGANGGTRDIELTLAPGAALKIRVRSDAGAPIARASVALEDSDGRVIQHTQDDVTDAHGELDVPGMKPGHWTVRAQARGFAPVALPIELTAGDARVLDVSLTPQPQPK